jgi:mannose-6-phosphate isomerase-like protein (cupin superfamily)
MLNFSRCCVALLVILLVSPLAAAQTAGAPPAPKDKAMDLTSAQLEAVAKEITAKGLITQRVLEGGVFSVNVRHISGSETALQHGRITEVWVVREGSGIVATGGTLIDPKPGATAGEFSGSAIRGGVEREIKAGDLVFIPPGVPHGIKQSSSITYLNIRFEAREAKE